MKTISEIHINSNNKTDLLPRKKQKKKILHADQIENSLLSNLLLSENKGRENKNNNLISLMDIVKSRKIYESNFSMISYSQHDFDVNYLNIALLIFLSSCGLFFMGYNEAVFDTLEEEIRNVFHWEEDEGETIIMLISTMITIGAAIGSLLGGLITSSLGRKASLVLLDIISIIGTVLTIIENPYIIIVGRVLVGIGVGGFTYVARLYMSEMSPSNIRAFTIALIEVFYMVGIEVAYLFGFGIKISPIWWKIMLGFNFLICGSHLIVTIAFFNYETPIYYYVKKKDKKKTINVLRCIYKKEEDIKVILKEYDKISNQKEEQLNLSYSKLFNQKNIIRMLFCIAIIASSIFIGVDAIIYFADYIFTDYTTHYISKLYINIIGGVQLIAAICGISFVEHLGRKLLLLIGHLVIIVTLIIIGALYMLELYYLLIYFFCILIITNAITINPVTNIYLTDVLPEKGLAMGYFFYYIFKLILTFTFKISVEGYLGYSGLFWLYGILTLIGILFIFLKIKETHGRTMKELIELY